MYTTQTNDTSRIQIFDQLSAHFIKTASSSMAKAFCEVFPGLQWKKILHLIAAGMTKHVGAFTCFQSILHCRQPFVRHAIQCHYNGHFKGVEERVNGKMFDY